MSAFRLRIFFGTALAGLLVGHVPSGAMQAKAPTLRLTFFALDHGESMLVQAPGGMTFLVGAGAAADAGEVIRQLQSRKIRRLDTVMLASWSDRHMGGIPKVLEKFPVRMFMRNPLYVKTATGDRILRMADSMQRAGQLSVHIPSPGEITPVFYQPPCEVASVAPTGAMLQQFAGDRNCSLVMEILFDRTSYLSLGDTSTKHQQAFWRQAPRKPWGHILQIGRGGSADAVTASLLKPLKTKVAVIPIPRKSGWKPAAQTLTALKRVGAKVYRTDRDGHITVTSDGRNVRVTSAK